MHLHEEIRDELLRRINDQEWPVGTELPDELQLAQEFGAARGTVRRALAALAEQGLIERRKRAGTRVIGRRGHASRLTIAIVREEIMARGHRYGYHLIESRPASAGCGGSANFPRGTRLWQVTSLHLADGQPFQLEDRLINLDALPEAASADFASRSPNEWLIERVPYTAVKTRLFAAAAGAPAGAALQRAPTAPVFCIERRTFRDDVPLTRVLMTHPAELYDITTEAS